MELSERWIKKFEEEGFLSIYEEQDMAGTTYETTVPEGNVSFFITDGSVTFDSAGETRLVKAGERLDIPGHTPYSITVGPQGWIAVIAKEQKGDS